MLKIAIGKIIMPRLSIGSKYVITYKKKALKKTESDKAEAISK